MFFFVNEQGLVMNFVRNETNMAVLKDVEKKFNVSIPELPTELYTSAYSKYKVSVIDVYDVCTVTVL